VLQRELIITAPPPVNAQIPEIITRAGNSQRLDVLDAVLEPAIVAPGATTRLTARLHFPADAQIIRGDVSGLTARLAGTGAPPVYLIETTNDTDLIEKTLSFAAELRAPTEEEVYRIDIDVLPIGQRAVYLSVARA
jgi:hypothetical protein